MKFGEWVTANIRARGWDGVQAAEAIGLDPSAISRHQNRTLPPHHSSVQKYEAAFGVRFGTAPVGEDPLDTALGSPWWEPGPMPSLKLISQVTAEARDARFKDAINVHHTTWVAWLRNRLRLHTDGTESGEVVEETGSPMVEEAKRHGRTKRR